MSDVLEVTGLTVDYRVRGTRRAGDPGALSQGGLRGVPAEPSRAAGHHGGDVR